MPKVTIYVPDRMYREAVAQKIDVTKVAQAAIAEALTDDVSTGERIRRTISRLEQIAVEHDRRYDAAATALEALGVDVDALMAGQPWAARRLTELRVERRRLRDRRASP